MAAWTCQRCGAALGASPHCTSCGFDLSARPGASRCLSCAAPLRPRDRYCGECGTDQVATVPSAAVPPDRHERHRADPSAKRPGGWLLAALVLVPLLIAGAGAALLLWPDHGESSATTPRPTLPTEPSPSPVATTSDVPDPGVRCWDGTHSDTLQACGQPSGAEGLRWVFPSFDPDRCRERARQAAIPLRLQLWDCRIRLDSGTTVTIRYSEWRAEEYADQLDHYTEKYSGGTRREVVETGRTVRYVWRSNALVRGVYESTSMYVGQPWSLSVDAPTIAARDAALRTVVEFRAAARLRGYPIAR